MQLVARELNSKLVVSIGSIFFLLPLIVASGQAHSTFCRPACKESSVRQPGASGFCYRAS